MRALNRIDNKPGYCLFGVCNEVLRKLTYYFFMILDEGTASFGNRYCSTELKENATLIKHFETMCIGFYGYPP